MTVFDVLALGWFWASSRCAPRCSAGSPDNELRFLDRWADLGRSYLDALEVPGREATRVQLVAADLWLPLGPTLEYELELRLIARHQVATCGTLSGCRTCG